MYLPLLPACIQVVYNVLNIEYIEPELPGSLFVLELLDLFLDLLNFKNDFQTLALPSIYRPFCKCILINHAFFMQTIQILINDFLST